MELSRRSLSGEDKKLTGKLLLAHGEVDENVPIAATLKLVEALLQANKVSSAFIGPVGTLLARHHRLLQDFEYFPLANENHSLGRRADAPQGSWAGASRYMIRRRFDYFVRHLLGAEPPAEYVLPQEEAEQAGQYE